MHAQNTFSRSHSLPYGHAAVFAPRRQAEQRFWLFVYAVLVFLIAVALGSAALLFWYTGYTPASAVAVVQAPVSPQPAGNLPLAEPTTGQPGPTSPQDAAPASGDLAAQPTPVAEVTQPAQAEPELEQPVQTQPETNQPAVEPEPVIQPTASPEPLEEPTHRQIYLGLENDYHSQLSVPNGSSACGPAALLIALDYYNLQSSLPTLIAQASFDPQQGGYDPTCTTNVVCTSPQALARLASEEYGLDVQSGEGWTFEQVYAALEAGSPVIADIAWDASTTSLGHFVVIYGIDPENQVVYYHDPYNGAGLSATWESFNARWSHTVDVGDPLQSGGYTRWGMAIYMR